MHIFYSINILNLKKELCATITANNYNLLAPEVLTLSQELDHLMTPLFSSQLHKANSKTL